MAKTVVGLFDTAEVAERVVRDLYSKGFAREDVSIVANNSTGTYGTTTSTDGGEEQAAESAGSGAVGGTLVGGGLGLLVGLGLLAIPGIGPVVAAGTLATVLGSTALGAGLGAATGGLIGALVGSGVPEDEAQVYAEGVRRGGTLVTINTSDDRADEAVAVLEESDPVNVEQREASLRESGWERFDPEGAPLSAEEINSYRNISTARATPTETRPTASVADGDTVVPVVEEKLTVDKREVQRGGVRVHTRVIETPIEEQVQLREEHVNVERRPVNRDVTAGDTEVFQERSFEVKETAEEAVINKQARVVEEVVVDKTVKENVETVRDTVRRTDVQVDQVGAQASSGYDSYATDFQSYYDTNLTSSGRSYKDYDPAFRYGQTLANDNRYSGKDWASFERDARTQWETDQPNSTWDQFKDSIRYAWDKARGRA